MAKGKNEEIDSTSEENATGNVATDRVEEAVTTEEKTVKFRALHNHKCNIGGVVYILEKGKEVRIPENIATILSHSEKGFRL